MTDLIELRSRLEAHKICIDLFDHMIAPHFNFEWILDSASARGRLDLVMYVIYLMRTMHLIDLNTKRCRNECQFSALQYAAGNGHTDVVKYLMDYTDFKYGYYNKAAAIRAASAGGHLDTVTYLIESHHVYAGMHNNVALLAAARNGHAHVINYLVSFESVDVHVRHEEALVGAIIFGHTEAAKALILAGADLNAPVIRDYAMREAAGGGFIKVIKYLMSVGVELTDEARHAALVNGHVNVVALQPE